MNEQDTPLLIIGGGPAGYTAAIYAARAGLSPILLEGMQPGGQLTTTTRVENFPGFPEGIDGPELMARMRQQAENVGATLLPGQAVGADLSSPPYQVWTDETRFRARCLIIATGASARPLGIPDEEKYTGRGVSSCATCDGFFYRRRTVAVVGGGDTACEEALYLASLAREVHMIVRKPHMRAQPVLQERVASTGNISVHYETRTLGIYGTEGVEGLHLVRRWGEADETRFDLPCDGLFLAIGHTPGSRLFTPPLACDAQGYLLSADGTPRTALPGVMVAGDVADARYRQAVVAAGSGARAAIEAEKYLRGL